MNHSKKPLLVILFSFLCVMLWQAWVVDHRSTSSLPAPEAQQTARSDDALLTLSAKEEVRIETDVLDMRINKRGATLTAVGLKHFPRTLKSREPFTMFHTDKGHQYTAQSGFEEERGMVFSIPSNHYVMAKNKDKLAVKLQAVGANGLLYRKYYVFNKGDYSVRVISEVENPTGKPVATGAHVSRFDLVQDFLPSEKSPEFTIDPDQPKPGWFTFSTFTGPAYFTKDTPYVKLPFKDVATKPLSTKVSGPNWIAMQQRYFIASWVNQDKDAEHTVRSSSLSQSDESALRKQFTLKNQSDSRTLAANSTSSRSAVLYAGPEEVKRLAPLARGLELTVDYGWLWFLSSIMFDIMRFLQSYLNNWGATIIVTTILIKLLFYKMSESSFKTMAQQRKLKPKLDAINAELKDQPEKKQQAILELYQKEGINPLRSGCLPSLLPLPFFIALYYVLIESVQLRHASFFWIPDLSSQDPFYILPLLMALSMLMQQRLSPPQEDPAQEKAMLIMPVMMCLMFAQFPAGLVLYSVTNQMLSNLQQFYVMRHYDAFKKA